MGEVSGRKLVLNIESIRRLSDAEAGQVVGGTNAPSDNTCSPLQPTCLDMSCHNDCCSVPAPCDGAGTTSRPRDPD